MPTSKSIFEDYFKAISKKRTVTDDYNTGTTNIEKLTTSMLNAKCSIDDKSVICEINRTVSITSAIIVVLIIFILLMYTLYMLYIYRRGG